MGHRGGRPLRHHRPHRRLAARRVRRPTTDSSSASINELDASNRIDGLAAPDIEIWGITATLDHLLTDNLMVRGEVRYDRIDKDNGVATTSSSTTAATTGSSWSHGPGRRRRRGDLQLQQVRRRVAATFVDCKIEGARFRKDRAPSAFVRHVVLRHVSTPAQDPCSSDAPSTCAFLCPRGLASSIPGTCLAHSTRTRPRRPNDGRSDVLPLGRRRPRIEGRRKQISTSRAARRDR